MAVVVIEADLPNLATQGRYVFTGTVSSVHWGNPHILFDVGSDDELMRIEWVTIAGAEKTGVSAQQIEVVDAIVVIGSRKSLSRNARDDAGQGAFHTRQKLAVDSSVRYESTSMILLIAGIILFLGVHSTRIVADGWRSRMVGQLA